MIPKTMRGVYLTGYGGYDKLEYREDIPTPVPKEGEVLVKIGAAAVNNTDINTRIVRETSGKQRKGEAMCLPYCILLNTGFHRQLAAMTAVMPPADLAAIIGTISCWFTPAVKPR